jgi:hypothetical protein
MSAFIYLYPYYTTLGTASKASSGLNAHWTAATLAEEFAKLRLAADAVPVEAADER